MSEWKTYKLGDLVTFQRGHDLTKIKNIDGIYPVAGSNGIIGYHNEFTTKAPGITIGRSGNIGSPYYYESNFWAHNTTLYVKEFKNCNPKYIYYLLKTMNFGGHNSGSAVPSLNRNYIHPIEVIVPDLAAQIQIAQILTSLDDKIQLNLQMNQNLEAMAQTIFKEWFVKFNFPGFNGELVGGLPKGWRMGKVEDLFVLQRGFDLPAITRTQGIYPVVAASGISTYHHEYKVLGPGVTTGRSGVLGKVYYINENFWPLNTSLFIKEYRNSTPLFAYHALKGIELLSLNGGSAVPTLNRNDVHGLEAMIPDYEIITRFEEVVKSLFAKIFENENQKKSLIQIRDSLLPKLMTGKIEVQA